MNVALLAECARKYTEKDLTSFGNYLLSNLRKKYVSQGTPTTNNVWHSDFKNWEGFTNKGKKEINFDKLLKNIKKQIYSI